MCSRLLQGKGAATHNGMTVRLRIFRKCRRFLVNTAYPCSRAVAAMAVLESSTNPRRAAAMAAGGWR